MKNILMVGPGRRVRGGISTVVNSYYELGLDKILHLKYVATMVDANKIKKIFIAFASFISFSLNIKKYDIIHVHMAAQASFTRKSLFIKKAKLKGKKIVIHQHAADFDEFFIKGNTKKQECIKKIFDMADKVIVLSEEWEKFFAENVCDKEKIIVLHNGVILPKYIKENYNDCNVLFLGKLGKRKGSYDLINAIPDILNIVPEAMFYLGGDGEVEQSQKIIEKKGLSEHVKLLGWIGTEEKEKYLKECSVFVLPSYHEGMPMSVLEAMSYGLATVSTNAGGIPQIIENGVDGYRVEAGDVKAITNILINLLMDQKLKNKIGRAAKTTIEKRFNAEKNITILKDLYSGM